MPLLFTKKLFVGAAHDSSSFPLSGLDIAPSNGRWQLLPRHCMALSCQASKTVAKSRISPTTSVISSTHQVKGLSFRPELCFCFLLCIAAPVSAWLLHSPAVGGMEGVWLLLFLNSELKTELCPYQVSKSCIFNPNGVESSIYVSKIWLPSNCLQSEIRRWEKCSLGSQTNQDEKIDKKWMFVNQWSDQAIKHGVLNPRVVTLSISDRKIDYFHYCLSKLHRVCAAAARTFPISVIIRFVWLVGKKPFSITRHYDQYPKEPSLNSHVRICRSIEIVVWIHFLIFFTWHSIYFLGSRDWFNHKHIMIMQVVQVLG